MHGQQLSHRLSGCPPVNNVWFQDPTLITWHHLKAASVPQETGRQRTCILFSVYLQPLSNGCDSSPRKLPGVQISAFQTVLKWSLATAQSYHKNSESLQSRFVFFAFYSAHRELGLFRCSLCKAELSKFPLKWQVRLHCWRLFSTEGTCNTPPFSFVDSIKSDAYRPAGNHEGARGGPASRHRASDQRNDHAVHHAGELSDSGRHPGQHRPGKLRRTEAG